MRKRVGFGVLVFPVFRVNSVNIAIARDERACAYVAPRLRIVGDEPTLKLLDAKLPSVALDYEPNTLSVLHSQYLSHLRVRAFSANGDFCADLVHSIDLISGPSLDDVITGFFVTKLSPREVQLVADLWRGGSLKEIAEQWHRSPMTIAKHRENLYQKCGGNLAPRDLQTLLLVEKCSLAMNA